MSPSFENKNFEKKHNIDIMLFQKLGKNLFWWGMRGLFRQKKAEEFMLLKNCIDQDASDEV